jgi:FKBP-type peptidyl-prolyl cis-trans isomerase FklB
MRRTPLLLATAIAIAVTLAPVVTLAAPAAAAAAAPAAAPGAAGAAAAGLDTDKKKFSYAVGLQIAHSLSRQGVDIDGASFVTGVQDAVSGAEPKISADEMKRILAEQEKKAVEGMKEKAGQNLKTGQDYRDTFKKQEGVTALPSGVLYKVITAGKGKQPGTTGSVSVNYVGKLINGTEFDNSQKHGGAATLEVDKVVKGWQEILPLMKEGAKWQVVIPPELAYGVKGAGPIGPNETLVFEIELLKVL